jgi:hypothetical protein
MVESLFQFLVLVEQLFVLEQQVVYILFVLFVEEQVFVKQFVVPNRINIT